jgi:hypothetical protein
MVDFGYTDNYVRELKNSLNGFVHDNDEYNVDIYVVSLLLISLFRIDIYKFNENGASILAEKIKQLAHGREKRRETIKERILDEDRRICVSTVPRLRNESRSSIS